MSNPFVSSSSLSFSDIPFSFSYLTPINSAESIADKRIKVQCKLLDKKSIETKTKALSAITDIMSQGLEFDYNFVVFFATVYPRLAVSNEKTVRIAAHTLCGIILRAYAKKTGAFLPSIVPVLLLGVCDQDRLVCSKAESSLVEGFKANISQKLLNLFHANIIEIASDFFEHVDPSSLAPKDSEFAYFRTYASMLKLLSMVCTHVFSQPKCPNPQSFAKLVNTLWPAIHLQVKNPPVVNAALELSVSCLVSHQISVDRPGLFKSIYKFLKNVSNSTDHVQSLNNLVESLILLDLKLYSSSNLSKLKQALLKFFSGLLTVEPGFFFNLQKLYAESPVYTGSLENFIDCVLRPFEKVRTPNFAGIQSEYVSFFAHFFLKVHPFDDSIDLLVLELRKREYNFEFKSLLSKISKEDFEEVLNKVDCTSHVDKLVTLLKAVGGNQAVEKLVTRTQPSLELISYLSSQFSGKSSSSIIEVLKSYVTSIIISKDSFNEQCTILTNIDNKTDINTTPAISKVLDFALKSDTPGNRRIVKKFLLGLAGHSEDGASYVERSSDPDIEIVLKFGPDYYCKAQYRTNSPKKFWSLFIKHRPKVSQLLSFIEAFQEGEERNMIYSDLWSGLSEFGSSVLKKFESVDSNSEIFPKVQHIYVESVLSYCINTVDIADHLADNLRLFLLSSKQTQNLYKAYFSWQHWVCSSNLAMYILSEEASIETLSLDQVVSTKFLGKYFWILSHLLEKLNLDALIENTSLLYFTRDALLFRNLDSSNSGDFDWLSDIEALKIQVSNLCAKFGDAVVDKCARSEFDGSIFSKKTIFDEKLEQDNLSVQKLYLCEVYADILNSGKFQVQCSFSEIQENIIKPKDYLKLILLESSLSKILEPDVTTKVAKHVFSDLLSSKAPQPALLSVFSELFMISDVRRSINLRQISMLLKNLEDWIGTDSSDSQALQSFSVLKFLAKCLNVDEVFEFDYGRAYNDTIELVLSVEGGLSGIHESLFYSALNLHTLVTENSKVPEQDFIEESEVIEAFLSVARTAEVADVEKLSDFASYIEVQTLSESLPDLLDVFIGSKHSNNIIEFKQLFAALISKVLDFQIDEYIYDFSLSYKTLDEAKVFGIPAELMEKIGQTKNLKEIKNADSFIVILLAWDIVMKSFFGPKLGTSDFFDFYEKMMPESSIEHLLDTICEFANVSSDPLIGLKKVKQLPFDLLNYNKYETKRQLSKVSKLSTYYKDQSFYESEFLMIRLYCQVLFKFKSKAQIWYSSIRDKQLKSSLEQYTTKFISSILIDQIMDEVSKILNESEHNTSHNPEDTDEESSDNHTYKVVKSSREIKSLYYIDEQSAELCVKFPSSFPLSPIAVSAPTRLGVKEQTWVAWLLSVTNQVNNSKSHSVSKGIVDGIQSFDKNMKLHFKGFEECSICYAILHAQDKSLASKKCQTCKNQFHVGCLLKWFKSSGNNTCPLCRQEFNFRVG